MNNKDPHHTLSQPFNRLEEALKSKNDAGIAVALHQINLRAKSLGISLHDLTVPTGWSDAPLLSSLSRFTRDMTDDAVLKIIKQLDAFSYQWEWTPPKVLHEFLKHHLESAHFKTVEVLEGKGVRIANAFKSDMDFLSSLHRIEKKENQVPVFDFAVKHGVPLRDWPDLMHKLFYQKDEWVLDKLIEHGVDLNGVSSDGLNLMHKAISFGRPALCQKLVDHGFRLKGENHQSNQTNQTRQPDQREVADAEPLSYFFKALVAYKEIMIDWLIDQGLPVSGRIPSKDVTLLTFALQAGCSEKMIRSLLEAGADPMEKDSVGRPIYMAIATGNLKAIEALVEYGEDLKTVGTESDITPLEFARKITLGSASEKVLHFMEGEAFSILEKKELEQELQREFEKRLVDIKEPHERDSGEVRRPSFVLQSTGAHRL